MKKNKTIKIKTYILIILLISVVSLSGCTEFPNLSGDNSTEGPYTVVFKVTDLETGNPIPVARINWEDVNNDNSQIYHTDANGKNIITDMKGGIYEFYVDARETTTKSYDSVHQQVTLNHNIQINVGLSIDTSTCEIIET